MKTVYISDMHFQIDLDGNSIENVEEIDILGIRFESKLNFDSHISSLCQWACYQISALQQLSNALDMASS